MFRKINKYLLDHTGILIRIDDIAENHPQIFDVHLPIGIIEYYSGISNNILKLAVRAYGLNPSVESGLNGIDSMV